MTSHELAVATAIIGTTASQLLLRIGARRVEGLWALLNPFSLAGYASLFAVTLLMVYALQGVLLSTLVILSSTTYILVPLASWVLLKEKATFRNFLGAGLIIVGIIVYAI